MSPVRVLSIAGSDPSGGAGVQADLKTFHALGCYGMAALTALTAQSTRGVSGVHPVPAAFVAEQLDALLDDCPPGAAKTGMLYSEAVVDVVVARAADDAFGPLVVDPVMVATSGDRLLRPEAEAAIRERLLPVAAVVTPNTAEAAVLTGLDVGTTADAERAADALIELGAAAALVKGGHGESQSTVTDVLHSRDGLRRAWTRPRLPVEGHGTGCTLSAAIAAGLALGLDLESAVRRAGDFVHAGLAASFPVGAGARPVNHLVAFAARAER